MLGILGRAGKAVGEALAFASSFQIKKREPTDLYNLRTHIHTHVSMCTLECVYARVYAHVYVSSTNPRRASCRNGLH